MTTDGVREVLVASAHAHDQSIQPEDRPILEAVADLAVVAIERHAS